MVRVNDEHYTSIEGEDFISFHFSVRHCSLWVCLITGRVAGLFIDGYGWVEPCPGLTGCGMELYRYGRVKVLNDGLVQDSRAHTSPLSAERCENTFQVTNFAQIKISIVKL